MNFGNVSELSEEANMSNWMKIGLYIATGSHIYDSSDFKTSQTHNIHSIVMTFVIRGYIQHKIASFKFCGKRSI